MARNIALFFALFVFVSFANELQYGSVIDAGSTGTRIWVFEWEKRESATSASPQTTPKVVGGGGFNNGGNNPVSGIGNINDCYRILGPLINHAKNLIPAGSHSESPVYLKATAGMRVLNETLRQNIMSYIRQSFMNTTFNPFQFVISQAVIASGEEEGTFGWLSVNDLSNVLFDKDGSVTYGALDLGGMSTQISFAAQPSSDILAGLTALRLWDYTYRLYTYSYLRYGGDGFEAQIAQYVYDNIGNLNNPCLNEGYSVEYTVMATNGSEVIITQSGNSTGNPSVCLDIIKELMYKSTICFTGNCAINGVYLPDIPSDMKFYAFSSFGYQIENSGLPTNSTPNQIKEQALEICNMTYLQANKTYYDSTPQQFIYSLCYMHMYIFVLLTDGYGFDPNTNNIEFTNYIDGTELGWTLGSIIRDANWLGWDITTSDTLTTEGKTYRALMIAFIALFVVACGIIAYCYFSRNKNKSDYGQM